MMRVQIIIAEGSISIQALCTGTCVFCSYRYCVNAHKAGQTAAAILNTEFSSVGLVSTGLGAVVFVVYLWKTKNT